MSAGRQDGVLEDGGTNTADEVVVDAADEALQPDSHFHFFSCFFSFYSFYDEVVVDAADKALQPDRKIIAAESLRRSQLR